MQLIAQSCRQLIATVAAVAAAAAAVAAAVAAAAAAAAAAIDSQTSEHAQALSRQRNRLGQRPAAGVVECVACGECVLARNAASNDLM